MKTEKLRKPNLKRDSGTAPQKKVRFSGKQQGNSNYDRRGKGQPTKKGNKSDSVRKERAHMGQLMNEESTDPQNGEMSQDEESDGEEEDTILQGYFAGTQLTEDDEAWEDYERAVEDDYFAQVELEQEETEGIHAHVAWIHPFGDPICHALGLGAEQVEDNESLGLRRTGVEHSSERLPGIIESTASTDEDGHVESAAMALGSETTLPESMNSGTDDDDFRLIEDSEQLIEAMETLTLAEQESLIFDSANFAEIDLGERDFDFNSDEDLTRDEHGYGENADISEEEEQEIRNNMKKKIIEQIVEAVKTKVLSPAQGREYQQLRLNHLDAFGVKQSGTRMANVEPMRVRLKPNVEPFRSEPRSMGRVKLNAMKEKLNALLSMRMIKRDENPFFSSPCFMVPKKKDRWRLVVDLRRVNLLCEQTAISLPNLEEQLSWFQPGNKLFAGLDLLSGFDMLRVHPEDTAYFGISTPWGTFRMLGSPIGFHSTPAIFQERMVNDLLGGIDRESGFFNAEHRGACQWLDDSLVYSEDFDGFIEVMSLKGCCKTGLRLNLDKCELVKTSITWCGRVLDSDGWRFSEKYFSKVLKIPEPQNVEELETAVYMAQWLGTSVPRCAVVKTPLQNLMTYFQSLTSPKGKKLSKSKRRKLSLEPYWKDEHKVAFKELLEIMFEASKKNLALYDRKKNLRIYSDASERLFRSCLNVTPCRLWSFLLASQVNFFVK